eukprot:CAMPEP_0172085286 /NCGR_PEP_ID=MMETSP1043-20130122/21465_1 /TAXON_ID=464988 /ORGANISM="Hemiselmis andersenii, Strain CCMP441" /LENGTH=88 /DNA_ID=CAMNT_0012747205 /DNA_START=18 /DNA_END=281 /DNA_ORIENTATION=+
MGRLLETHIEEIVGYLEKSELHRIRAQSTYLWLLERYPNSVVVLYSYAQFCDTVANDNKKALGLRQQASLLEEGEDTTVKDEAEREMM